MQENTQIHKAKISLNVYRRALSAKPVHKTDNVWLCQSRTCPGKSYTVMILLRADFFRQIEKNNSCPASGFDYVCDCEAGRVRGLCHHALSVKRQVSANHAFLFLSVGLTKTAAYRGANGFYARIEQILRGKRDASVPETINSSAAAA